LQLSSSRLRSNLTIADFRSRIADLRLSAIRDG
jgi:hypothetical protein